MPGRYATLLLLLLSACTAVVPPAEEPDARHDAPDAAARYRALKQQGTDDPFRSLAEAREAMRRLPVHSTALDQLVDAQPRSNVSPLGRWEFLGPGNIGGRTRVLVINPDQPHVMYTGGVSGGVWKTTTAGLSWAPIGDDLANIAINSLVMHPTDRNTLYAGTGEGYFRETVRGTALPLRGDGIFVTRDAGETWTRLTATANTNFHYVNDLAVSTKDPNRIYAATRTGVWRSSDAGATWTHVLPVTVTGGCLDLAHRTNASGDYLFAACGTFEQSTVYRARNAETNAAWEAVLSQPNMGRTTLAIAPSNPSVVYALAATNEEGVKYQGLLGVFRSQNDGDAGSWETRQSNEGNGIGPNLLTNLITASQEECGLQAEYITMGWYCNTIAVDPVDADRVWVGGVDLFRSDNGGRTWGVASYWWGEQGTDPSFVHADQHAIVFHPRYDGSTVRTAYFTNDGGLYRTDDALAPVSTGPEAACGSRDAGTVFVALNNNYGVTQFYHGAVSPDGRTFIAGAQDNGTLLGTVDDGPNDWRMILGGDGAYVAIDPNDPEFVYAESQWGVIHRSSNGGRTFQRIRGDTRDDQFLFVTPYTIDPLYTRRLWIGGRHLWRTDDRGSRWRRASRPLPGLVSAIAVQPNDSERVLAGTATGHIARIDTALTAGADTSWTLVQPREGFISSIAFDPTTPATVYATYAGFGGAHVWVSTDGGVTWSPRNGDLPDVPVHSIAVDPTRPARLYLGTDLGVFVSVNAGATWAVENSGFANAVTESLFIGRGARGPAIYAFTHGRGAWRADLVSGVPRRRGVRQ